jgi:peptide/nickel transport system ATP-binding protein
MSESLITVRDLNIHFPIKRGVLSKTVGYVYAVDGVSFELARGKRWASSANRAAERPRRAWR